jgi:hypothetical protein
MGVSATNGGHAGEQLVEGGAEAVDVGPAVEGRGRRGPCSGDMYEGVPSRAPGPGELLGIGVVAGDAEVHDDWAEAAVGGALDEDVAGLDVAVEDAELVGLVEGDGAVAEDHDLVMQRQLEAVAQRLAGDQFHGDVGLALDLADLEDLADVGVVDAGLGAGLAEQAGREIGMIAADELEGDGAAELRVVGAVDGAHAAVAEHCEELVAAPVRDGEAAGVRAVGCAAVRGIHGEVGAAGRDGVAESGLHRGDPSAGQSTDRTSEAISQDRVRGDLFVRERVCLCAHTTVSRSDVHACR